MNEEQATQIADVCRPYLAPDVTIQVVPVFAVLATLPDGAWRMDFTQRDLERGIQLGAYVGFTFVSPTRTRDDHFATNLPALRDALNATREASE